MTVDNINKDITSSFIPMEIHNIDREKFTILIHIYYN